MASKSEFVFTVLMSVLGLVVIVMSYQLGFGSMRQPEAGFFPLLIGVIIFVFGALLVFEYLKHGPLETLPAIMFGEGGIKRFLGTIICLIAWLVLMPWLGYIIMTLLVSVALFKVMGLEGWLYPVLISLGMTLFTYMMFDVWFYIDLPRGILG